MLPLGAIWTVVAVILLFFSLLLVGGLGLAAIPKLWMARRRLVRSSKAERQIADGSYPKWRSGEDLIQYPKRLAELESQLVSGHDAVQEQIAHLKRRMRGVAAKEGRGDLEARYSEDTTLLEKRAAHMRRVMGLVWRTRAMLEVRAHVAITARNRPSLLGIPEGAVEDDNLIKAAEAYEKTAASVRAFVVSVENRVPELSQTIPSPPMDAEVLDEDRNEVAEEAARARRVYADLQDRMDRLADSLSYLADRCRTRQVVRGAPAEVDSMPGAEQLFHEVNSALGSLNELADVGDRRVADTAMDNLAEDITQLERAGLEAKAEADAAFEVARLLEQFPS